RLLLVDDDPNNYGIFREMLALASDYRFETAWKANYEDGLAELLTGAYDVCFVDFRLGGQRTGIDLIRAASDAGSRVPAVLLTAQGGSDTDLRALAAGASDYLAKGSFGSDGLVRTIRYAIERAGAREQALAREKHFRHIFERSPIGH